MTDLLRKRYSAFEFPRKPRVYDHLRITYEIVDDPSTDSIISWGSNGESFIIWNPKEFVKYLPPVLRSASLTRYETSYGFRKVDGSKGILEFANDDFVKGQPERVKKIGERYLEKLKKIADPIIDQVKNAKSREEVDFLLKEYKERCDRKMNERTDRFLANVLKDVMQRIAKEKESRDGANFSQVLEDQLLLARGIARNIL